jgi:hypothetical protein
MSPLAAAVRAETDAFFASRLARPTIESIMGFTPPLQPRTTAASMGSCCGGESRDVCGGQLSVRWTISILLQ